MREKISRQSRGFAFVEFFNTEDATTALREVQGGIRIDDQPVKCSFARNANSSSSILHTELGSKYASEALLQAQWLQSTYGDTGSANEGAIVTIQNIVQDQTSGCYYDSSTGFIYDSTSGYYYDLKTKTYYYYDSDKTTYYPYKPVPELTPQNTDEITEKDKSDTKDKTKQ